MSDTSPEHPSRLKDNARVYAYLFATTLTVTDAIATTVQDAPPLWHTRAFINFALDVVLY